MIRKYASIISIAFVSVLLISGCASTGVVQMDAGVYMISKKSAQVGFGPPIGIRAEVYQEANDFCAGKQAVVETVNLELTNAGLARSAVATLIFKCKPKMA